MTLMNSARFARRALAQGSTRVSVASHCRLNEARQVVRHPTAPRITTFWYRDPQRNFGDLLTPYLFSKFGLSAVWRNGGNSQVAGVGSILQMLPATFSGAIFGSGLISNVSLSLPGATFLALRGRRTAENVGAPQSVALGDPGLLMAGVVSRLFTVEGVVAA